VAVEAERFTFDPVPTQYAEVEITAVLLRARRVGEMET